MSYKLLPFRFRRLGDKILLINETGQFHCVNEPELYLLVNNRLDENTTLFNDFLCKDFISLDYTFATIDRIATQYRTKKRFLFDSTALHMFVVTQRCNQKCLYCHASSEDDIALARDMPPDIGRKCTELAFESPSPDIKIEFQGGEPLLNFQTIIAIVEHAEKLNAYYNKDLSFVLCSNLLQINDDHLEFLKKHNISISTSLDGAELEHNSCRKATNNAGSFSRVSANIARAQNCLGKENVSALMTVTCLNINKLDETLDTYLAHGLTSIFPRMLNPFGRAATQWARLAYPLDKYLEAYFALFQRIMTLNYSGTYFVEEMARILLRKILTPFDDGYVDIQSPSGAGISAIVYEIDGKVFLSDEARMYYKTTLDERFCLGNALASKRSELFARQAFANVLRNSVLETLPGCSWCAYLPYCGTDPIRNYATQGDMVSHKAFDDSCKFMRAVLDMLFENLLSNDEHIHDIFWSWITQRPYHEINLGQHREAL